MTAFTVTAGTTQTARITMAASDTLTVEATGSLSVSANAQAVRFTASASGAIINNSGTIEDTAAGGRAIRFENTIASPVNATINNLTAGSVINGVDDAIQIADNGGAVVVTSGTVAVNNVGSINSSTKQAIDFAATGGTFVTNILNSGSITADIEDAIRIGSASATNSVTNSATINGGSAAGYSGADGVQFEDNAKGMVTNNAGGTISGDRHGINAGAGSVITVINNLNATLIGRNGSGVGSDGTATVTNYGTITGAFDPNASDINGPGGPGADGTPDGDGDGIDIDGEGTIDNYGLIQGTGASGHGSDGHPNTSEAIATGGGTITNRAGATIIGLANGILNDNSSQGNAPFLSAITNLGTITGTNGIGIWLISDKADTIDNNGTITGGGGAAIRFGDGDNSLIIRANSVINGNSDGGNGTDTLNYSNFGNGAVTVNLNAGTATGTGGVTHFENVIGGGGNDSLTGDANANVLSGGAGNDTLIGGAGSDTAKFSGNKSDYSIVQNANGFTITDLRGGSPDGTDRLFGIESAQFLDQTFTLPHLPAYDFNGDNFGDILVQNPTSGQIAYGNMAGGTFQSWVHVSSTPGFTVVGNGRIAGDSSFDVVIQNAAGQIDYANLVNGSFSSWTLIANTPGWDVVGVGDVNRDNFADVVAQSQTTGQIAYANMLNGAFQGWANVGSTPGWTAKGAADINGDGFADIVAQNQTTGQIGYANMLNGALQGWVGVGSTLGWDLSGVGDVNGDGFADIVIQNQSNGQIAYANMAGGTFQSWVNVANAPGNTVTAVEDVNNDGFQDIVVQSIGASGQLAYANMLNGTFQSWVGLPGAPGWTAHTEPEDVPSPVRMFDPGPQVDGIVGSVNMFDPGPAGDVPAPVRMFDPGPQATSMTTALDLNERHG